MTNGLPVIDADGHVTEPLNLWTDYVEPAYRARAPRVILDERGRPCLLLSDYFKRQCVISTDPEEPTAEPVVRWVGEDCLVWASDYPHPDAHFPGAVSASLATMGELPVDVRRKIFADNAARLYRIALPR